jgi:hypothetical protein
VETSEDDLIALIHQEVAAMNALERARQRLSALPPKQGGYQGVTETGHDQEIDVTIRVTQEQLTWAIQHINNWIAKQPVNTEPDAHRFVSALSHPLRETPAG